MQAFSSSFFQKFINLFIFFIYLSVNEAQISDDGEWIWLNGDWQYLSDLDVSQYGNNADDTGWTGKNFTIDNSKGAKIKF